MSVLRRDSSIYSSCFHVVSMDIMVPNGPAVLQTLSDCGGVEAEVFKSGSCSSSTALRVTDTFLERYSTKCWNMKRKSKNIDICIKEDDQSLISMQFCLISSRLTLQHVMLKRRKQYRQMEQAVWISYRHRLAGCSYQRQQSLPYISVEVDPWICKCRWLTT